MQIYMCLFGKYHNLLDIMMTICWNNCYLKLFEIASIKKKFTFCCNCWTGTWTRTRQLSGQWTHRSRPSRHWTNPLRWTCGHSQRHCKQSLTKEQMRLESTHDSPSQWMAWKLNHHLQCTVARSFQWCLVIWKLYINKAVTICLLKRLTNGRWTLALFTFERQIDVGFATQDRHICFHWKCHIVCCFGVAVVTLELLTNNN